MIVFHGITKEKERVIKSQGLRKGSFVSPDFEVAKYFAMTRANWNKELPVVLEFEIKDAKVYFDRSGRPEIQLGDTAKF